jgi:hypothetical protein
MFPRIQPAPDGSVTRPPIMDRRGALSCTLPLPFGKDKGYRAGRRNVLSYVTRNQPAPVGSRTRPPITDRHCPVRLVQGEEPSPVPALATRRML